jgi:hypothetical protein
MFKRAVMYAESLAIIVAVSVAVHYLSGLDWPWAIVIGAATSVVLRRLIHSGTLARLRNRPLAGDR